MFPGVRDKTFCTGMQNGLSIGISMCGILFCGFSEELRLLLFTHMFCTGKPWNMHVTSQVSSDN